MDQQELELLKKLREFDRDVRDDVVTALQCVESAKPEAASALLERASVQMEKLLRLITEIERPWEKQK